MAIIEHIPKALNTPSLTGNQSASQLTVSLMIYQLSQFAVLLAKPLFSNQGLCYTEGIHFEPEF
jgi:hypothetical protein